MAAGDNLLDAVTADTVATELKRARRHSLPLGAPCANCATPLAGPWCHACGQRGEDYHRSILKLAWEALEGLTDLDGRLWKTIPRLILRPGKLTREFLEGRRASQIPPFRLFLIMLVLVFFAGGQAVERNRDALKLNNPGAALGGAIAPKDKAEFDKGMAEVEAAIASDQQAAKATGDLVNKAKAKADFDVQGKNAKQVTWLKDRVQRAIKNPEVFFLAVQEWAHRLAVLMLPIAALMLTVLFAFRRGVYVFDHLIFAMHSLSFVGILLTICFAAAALANGAWWLLWAAPIHLFFHMRGAYRTGVLGTLWRMFWLFLGTSVVLAFLAVGLIFLGLAAAH